MRPQIVTGLYTPVLPDGIPGATVMVSPPCRDLCELYVALIVPESNWYGAASLPVGVTGAGSRCDWKASLSVRVPLDVVSSRVNLLPKAS